MSISYNSFRTSKLLINNCFLNIRSISYNICFRASYGFSKIIHIGYIVCLRNFSIELSACSFQLILFHFVMEEEHVVY